MRDSNLFLGSEISRVESQTKHFILPFGGAGVLVRPGEQIMALAL